MKIISVHIFTYCNLILSEELRMGYENLAEGTIKRLKDLPIDNYKQQFEEIADLDSTKYQQHFDIPLKKRRGSVLV